MSDLESDLVSWQDNNDRYLSAALTWLRLRLERMTEPAPEVITYPAAAKSPAPGEPASSARRWSFLRTSPPPAGSPASPVLALPPASEAAIEERIAEAAREMAEAEAADPPPALCLLGDRFGLSRFEREILLLCVALELDTHMPRLCAMTQGDVSRPHPSFALAFALFDEPAWDALSPERPLRHWRLLEINQPGAQPLTASALRADERIVNYLKGLSYLDDRLAPLVAPIEIKESEPDLPPSQQEVAEAVLRHLSQGGRASRGRLPLVQLLGRDTPSKQRVAVRVAEALGLHLYRLPAGLLPSQASEIEALARLWQRESLLLPIALYLEAGETEGAEASASALHRFIARTGGLLFLDTREVWRAPERSGIAFDVSRPTPAEQRAAWAAALGEAAGDAPTLLSGQFDLDVETIAGIARTAPAEALEAGGTLADALWNACLLHTRPRLDALAQRLDPRATWEDIVLPEAERRTLRQIADQVGQRGTVYDEWGFRRKMNRGLGINALFAGASGTGKTMAAEVLANELRLNIYRIDLSAVVSKYIGETEKNLRRLFDVAEDGGAILFFDEADAIFGKRSEVKDSHDRYANIEVNYLLQRMESYRGLAILATNMKDALDTAFLRRLRFIVNFPHPGPDDRKAIWQSAFPAETPQEGLDLDRLARFNLTGGNIHNIAINAAFLAARARTPVTMPLVLDAVRSEIRKLDKPVNEAELRWVEPAKVPA